MAMDLSKSKNASRMKAIQEKSKEQGNGLVTINIPLDEIDENPDNEKTFNMEKVDAIARNIEQVGFFGTINVFKKPDGRYEISSGHTRYRAMKKIGADSIPCSVSPYPDEFKRGLILLSSNTNNRVMRPMDWARAIDYYYNLMKAAKKEFGKGEKSYEGDLRTRAAEFFDTSPTNIARYYSLLNLIPELQEMVDDPELPYSAFTTAGTMSEEDQMTLYERLSDEIARNAKSAENGGSVPGISRVRIEQLINSIKNKPDNTAQQNKSYGGFVTGALNNLAGAVNGPVEKEYIEETENVQIPMEFAENNDFVNETETEDEENEATYTGENYEESPVPLREDMFVAKNYSQEMDLGVVSKTSSSASVESRLGACIPEIERIANGKFEIVDASLVKKYIERLRNAIDIIEKSI